MAIIDVVKFNGPPRILAWKYPSQELSTWTQLIVNESQEAVFYKGGQALDVLGPGTHSLDTNNLPILRALLKLPFGGETPFAAEVWFVNKTHSLDVKWGTASPIQTQDPKFGIMAPVRANGQFGVQVENSAKFLVKLVGATPSFDQDALIRYFRGVYLTKVKDTLAQYLIQKKISVLEISAYLDELSGHMAEKLTPYFAEYGIRLLNFYVNDVSVPDNDPAVIQLKNALAKKAEMNIIGYDYREERSFNTLEEAAKNPGAAGSVMGAGVGLGMGLGLGGAMGQRAGDLAQNINVAAPAPTVACPKCQAKVPANVKFCPDCGQNLAPSAAKAIKCDKCGALMSPKAKFCPECGDPYNPCPKCGEDLPKGAASCPACGYAFPNPCPNCGEPIERPDVKFCPACGQSLARDCPACHATNAPGAKFCLNCGAKL
ncbi:MAG: SPFH domain-containing protein [Deltaproteobacteria bacterium]|jgi:membrane protease subunit (stomatin/prohibitin family)|nr:SPFH domain-containing protein [Deltaproteobacteria bacterium]